MCWSLNQDLTEMGLGGRSPPAKCSSLDSRAAGTCLREAADWILIKLVYIHALYIGHDMAKM